MPSSKHLFRQLLSDLSPDLPEAEREAMTFMLLDHFGISTTDVLTGREIDSGIIQQLNAMVSRVNNHEPIQYVLGYAWFHGLKLKVDPSVLIPRPETEGLVELVLDRFKEQEDIRVSDLCTGSGAIAVALANSRPGWLITATDFSIDALQTARSNAAEQRVVINLILHDALSAIPPVQGSFHAIVSNPPYIPLSEKSTLAEHVVAHEPSMALFTADAAGMEFYQAIARIAMQCLAPSGLLAVEIHERGAAAVAKIFTDTGFSSVEVIKDQFGKDRYVTALSAKGKPA
ncbi:MAG: peptide chain release factor N(5)-glutamine methyltransferase [Bacteroidota bacterium]